MTFPGLSSMYGCSTPAPPIVDWGVTAIGTSFWARTLRLDYLVLLRQWVSWDVRSRYRRSALRLLWAFLQPAFTVATYAFIFGVIFSQGGGELPYLTYILAGIVVYRVVSGALSSITCMVDNAHLMSHSHFPREVIPISRILGNGLDLLIMTTGLIVVAFIQGVRFHITIIALPVVLLSTLLFAAALCIFFSTVQVFVRDLEFVMSFVVMGLFFASPISYLPQQLPTNLRWLNWANPISAYVLALRDSALLGRWPSRLFYVHAVLALALLVAAIAHLRAVQHRIVDLG